MKAEYGNDKFIEGEDGHVSRLEDMSLEECARGNVITFYKYLLCCPG